MQKITPFLWYNDQAEQAVRFYTTVFKNCQILGVSRMGPGDDAPAMTVNFTLDGQEYIALNGGPSYALTPAFSLMVSVETQAEVDELWDKLTADGGEESRCGWLVDRFGLSWQITPTVLGQLLGDPDREKAGRAMDAMLKMNKLDIAELRRAHAGQ